jgi:hypothetical protein
MPGDMHREVDDMKYEWPECVRKNFVRDPLLIVAAIVLSVHDFAEFVRSHARRIADWLVDCVEALRLRYGERWWETLELPNLWA